MGSSPSRRGTSASAVLYASKMNSPSFRSSSRPGSNRLKGGALPRLRDSATHGKIGISSAASSWTQGCPPKTSSAPSPEIPTFECCRIARKSR